MLGTFTLLILSKGFSYSEKSTLWVYFFSQIYYHNIAFKKLVRILLCSSCQKRGLKKVFFFELIQKYHSFLDTRLVNR